MQLSKSKIKGLSSGFTLLELLIVVGILSFVMTILVLVLNPVEFFRRARDIARVQDVSSIEDAVNIAEFENKNLGNTNIVYISIPDTAPDCSNLGLPILPPGWSYACADEDRYRKVDGSGWLPVDLSSLSIGAPFSALPIDPVNDPASTHYYAYVADDSYAVTALLESEKLLPSIAAKDGGFDYARYEAGSNFDLWRKALGIGGWWTFDDGSGTMARDLSGNSNDGTLVNGPSWVDGKFGGALRFRGDETGKKDYVNVPNNMSWATDHRGYTFSFWVKPIVNTNWDVSMSVGDWNGNAKIYRHDIASFAFNVFTAGGANNWICGGDAPSLNYLDIPDEEFHYVVLSIDATELGESPAGNSYGRCRLYSDGKLLVTDDHVDGETDFGGLPLRLGGDGGGGTNYLNGDLDEIRVYNRAFSETEVEAWYKALK